MPSQLQSAQTTLNKSTVWWLVLAFPEQRILFVISLPAWFHKPTTGWLSVHKGLILINSALILFVEEDVIRLQPVPVCHFALREDVPHLRLASESVLYIVDHAKLCEKCNEKEGGVEDKEKDPVGPTQVEPAQWDNDEGQDQRQTQRSYKNPRQQTLHFKLGRRKRQKIMFTGSKTIAVSTTTMSLYLWPHL